VTEKLKRILLAGVTLAVLLGVSVRVREIPAHAQAAGAAAAPDIQSADKADQEVDETAEYRHSPMVRKIGGMMGMDAEQSAVAFEWANFLLLAGAIGWAVVKFVPKTLSNRSSAIQKELVDARSATEEASARLTSVEVRLTKLDGEIAAMRTQAEHDSVKDEQRILASVEEEKKKILEAAEQEIAAATMHAQKALQQFAAELAIEQAARKLVVSAETDRLLVQGFARRLTGDESKKGQN
jgi:F-type H+-transporting ATPase subunit b